MAVFYRGIWHVHAGIYVGSLDTGKFILAKKNFGYNLPLEIETEFANKQRFSASIVKYWTPKRSIFLEEIYLG